MNYPFTPPDTATPDDWPPPDLSEALPCKCGSAPDWDWCSRGYRQYEFIVHCPRHCTDGNWEPTIDKAIARWNMEVEESKE